MTQAIQQNGKVFEKFEKLNFFKNLEDIKSKEEPYIQDSSNRMFVMQSFTSKSLQSINNMLLDVQAQMMQMNQCWSETLARFFYELKQQREKRKRLTNLLQIIVEQVIQH